MEKELPKIIGAIPQHKPDSGDLSFELTHATNEVVKQDKNAGQSIENLVNKVSEKFIETQLNRFPFYCYEARKVNKIKQDLFAAQGNSGGWSEKKDFKFDYEIPRDLYLFMANLVYKNFWEENNEKIWRPFMKSIMQGDDAMELLIKIKMIYGSNKDLSLTQ